MGARDIEAGRAFLQLGLKSVLAKQLSGALNDAGRKLQSGGQTMMRAGAAIGGAGAAVLAPILGSIRQFAKFGDELDKMSRRTGVAAPALAELGFAAEQSGLDLAKVENAVRKMQKTIGDANRGLSTAVDGLGKLGLSAQQLNGMAPEDQFQMISDRLREIKDPTEQASAAMDVFGSRTGTALLPMLGSMRELRQEARDLGLVPTQKTVDDAAKVTDAFNRIKRSIGAVAFEIGASLADEVLAFSRSAKNIIQTVRRWIVDNVGLVKAVAAVGAGLVVAGAAVATFGGAMIAAGAALSGTATVIATIGTAVSLLLTPMGAVAALLAGGVVAWAAYTGAGKAAFSSLVGGLRELLKIGKETVGGIADAISAGDIELAGQIAFAGLLDAINMMFGETVTSIAGRILSGDISGAWTDLTTQMGAVWAAWSEGVVKTFTGVADKIIGAWRRATKSISDQILELAAAPGFGQISKLILGVDVGAEVAKARRLGTYGDRDPLDVAKAGARRDLDFQADEMLSKLDEVNKAAEAKTRAASDRARAVTKEGMSNIAKIAVEARGKLAALRARKAVEESAKVTGEGSAASAIGVGGSSILPSFSAAALQAQAFGGRSGPERTLREQLMVMKNLEETSKRQLQKLEALGIVYE